jgi:4-amino-4-deoxy-L-arabinose transferase-like glycosyltransferase
MTYKPMPPLYFFLTHASYHWLGGEAGLRAVSFIAGMASMLALYALVSGWMGRAAGIAAVVFMSATPGVFFYFVDANPYSMLVLAVLLSILALERALEGNRRRDWFLYSLTLLGGLSIHLLFIFYAAAQWLIPFMRLVKQSRKTQGARVLSSATLGGSPIPGFCIALAATLSLWLAWVVFYFKKGGYQKPPDLERLFTLDTVFCLGGMIPGILTYGHWIQWICFPILLCAGLWILWNSHREKIAEWLAIWILPVLMITVFIRLTLTFTGYRYGLGVFPVTALIAVIGAGMGRESLHKAAVRPIANQTIILKSVLAVYVLAGFFRLAFSGTDLFTYQDWKHAAAYLNAEAAPCDRMWLPNEATAFPLRFYSSSMRLPSIVWSLNRGSGEVLQDLVQLGGWADAAKCRVWVVLPDFSNSVPWIESRTRSSDEGNPGKRLRGVLADLPKHSRYHLVTVREYRRVRIFRMEPNRSAVL